MDAHKVNFQNIFDKIIYQIPYFQRPYVWGNEQLENFIKNMIELTNSCKSEYFMGIIISKNSKSDKIYDLIDGQQRITTFILFFKALSRFLNANAIFDENMKFTETDYDKDGNEIVHSFLKLKTNYYDQPLLDTIVNLQNDVLLDENCKEVPINTIFKKKQLKKMPTILNAYNVLRLSLNELANQYSINYQTHKLILGRVKFIDMKLGTDDDAQVYFDNTNALGVHLSTGEIVKNYLFTEIENGVNEYNLHWKSRFEEQKEDRDYWYGNVSNGRRVSTNIDSLLFYYMQIKAYDGEYNIVGKRELYSSQDAVSSSIRDFDLNYIQNKKILRDEIIKYADVYRSIVDLNIGECNTLHHKNTLEDKINRLFYLISRMRVSPMIPYVMYVLVNANQKSQEEILEYLESYLIRRCICNNVSTKNYNRFFREELIGNKVVTLEELQKKLRVVDNSCRMPTDNEILSDIQALTFTDGNEKPKALLFLYEMELLSRNISHAQGQINYYPNNYNLEHLAPQDQNEWKKVNENVLEENVYKLGNMSVITEKTNKTIKNWTWKKKRNGANYNNKYFPGFSKCCTSPVMLYNIQDAIAHEIWDDDAITSRTEKLIKEIIKIWKY